MYPLIIPAILVKNFKDFKRQTKSIAGLTPYAQIDVGDGAFVPTKTFLEREEINKLKIETPLELHLMVQNPIAEIEKWKEVKNIFRVVFHIESKIDHQRCLYAIRSQCWQAGIALNPKTPISSVKKYLPFVNLIQFMTVTPGRQGSDFIPEIKRKIKEFNKLKDKPLVSVDGGINKNNIAEVRSWGVDIFNVGSALTLVKNPKIALKELKQALLKQ